MVIIDKPIMLSRFASKLVTYKDKVVKSTVKKCIGTVTELSDKFGYSFISFIKNYRFIDDCYLDNLKNAVYFDNVLEHTYNHMDSLHSINSLSKHGVISKECYSFLSEIIKEDGILFLDNNSLYVATEFREVELEKLTTDNVLVKEMIDNGFYSFNNLMEELFLLKQFGFNIAKFSVYKEHFKIVTYSDTVKKEIINPFNYTKSDLILDIKTALTNYLNEGNQQLELVNKFLEILNKSSEDKIVFIVLDF